MVRSYDVPIFRVYTYSNLLKVNYLEAVASLSRHVLMIVLGVDFFLLFCYLVCKLQRICK